MPLPLLPLWRWPVVAVLVGTTALLGYTGSWVTGTWEATPSLLRTGTNTCARHLHPPPFPVHAFWHISHAKGDWEYIVRDQVRRQSAFEQVYRMLCYKDFFNCTSSGWDPRVAAGRGCAFYGRCVFFSGI